MSFEGQERVLFDLLFDRDLRGEFAKSPAGALRRYGLDAAELADFTAIKAESLDLDSSIRTDLILSNLCGAFPVTFSIVSSLSGGFEVLKALIDLKTMNAPPHERAVTFGARLREKFAGLPFETPRERMLAAAIHEAELGMVWTSTTLKRAAIDGTLAPEPPLPPEASRTSTPVRLAGFVSAAMIPLSYAQLKKAFCPSTGAELWRRLNQTPLPAARRSETLRAENPRMLIAKAHVSHMSACEPAVDHRTAELAEGFAPILQHVNGTLSIDQLTNQLKKAGAPDAMAAGVRSGLLQLLEAGMLESAS